MGFYTGTSTVDMYPYSLVRYTSYCDDIYLTLTYFEPLMYFTQNVVYLVIVCRQNSTLVQKIERVYPSDKRNPTRPII